MTDHGSELDGSEVHEHDHDHVHDEDAPVDAGPVKRFLLWIIGLYRLTAPVRTPRCRYFPTCSEYAMEAIETHGVGRGTWLAARRLGRCHPFGSFGFDPVPEKKR